MKNSFILLVLLFTIIGCKSVGPNVKQKAATNQNRPNIIFIMADDHAAQAISAYGHELGALAPTPNIDRLAKNGVLFKNSFCTNAICGPSRAVILTGNHSHINGFRQNGEVFDGKQSTLPKKLQKLGYATAMIGKWHLDGSPQGFDYWNILNDQGNYYNPQFIHAKEKDEQGKAISLDTTTIEGYATDITTEYAIDWLTNKRSDKKPFFMMVHHKAPHRNWMPAPRHLNKYDTVTFPLPDSYFSEHIGQQAAKEQQQTIYKDMYEGHDLKMSVGLGSNELAHNPWKTDFDRMTSEQRNIWDNAYRPKNDAMHTANLSGRELAEWKGQRYLQDYLSTVAAIDEGVGEILDYLERTGLAKNTLVIYTSDQGFYLGEQGWFDKRFMYEESLRMPLLMQLPGVIKSGSTINAMVQNLDFAPTILDLAGGLNENYNMQGESFKGLLNGTQKEDDFRDVVYYHYYDYPAFHMVKKHYGIRTTRYKLMHFYDDIDAWEFYDLEKDPKEAYNAINDEHYATVVQHMHQKLDSVQNKYKVTEKEFEKAPKEKIENAYKQFKRLRGNN
ncbi:sulfatase [Flavobacteriaceae bacterium KMM 6897]|nr:sulfatase [Flavobacteriaceae bacterium KMM 6897]MEB8347182.1 sulfatase [Flavobacteriaceae bacterium KMM 6898]